MALAAAQPANEAFWGAFRGAGFLTIGGVAMMGEAASLFSLKLANSINANERVLAQIQNITCIALLAIAVGSAMIVTLSTSITANYIFTGAASLLFSIDLAEKLSFLASLAFAAYTVSLHYNVFHWAFTPYHLE